MNKHFPAIVAGVALLFISGCSTTFIRTGIGDLHRSSELMSESVTGILGTIAEEEMDLRAEQSVNRDSISVSDLKPEVITHEHIRTRRELLNCITDYTMLLNELFRKDHSYEMRKYGDRLRSGLSAVFDSLPAVFPEETKGVISTLVTMVPEGVTFLRKKKFAVRLMTDMQAVIEKTCGKLSEEVASARMLAPNLYTRLFREKVEKKWPEKEDKRLKFAETGLKIVKRMEKFDLLAGELREVLEMFPVEHRKLLDSLRNNGNFLYGLSGLLDYSHRVRNNYLIFIKGE